MNLDELQSVQSRERQTDKLQQLRATFYEEAGQFVAQLREERERAAERADDPFDSPEVNRLSDDIKTAEQTVEAVYERRVGKIVKMASLAAADMPTEDDGLTQEERHLFETMVEAIESNRQHVLDVVAGDSPASPADGADSTADGAGSEPATTDGVGSETPPADSTGVEPSVDAAELMGDGPVTDETATTDTPAPPGDETDAAPRDERRDVAAGSTDADETDRPTEEAPSTAEDRAASDAGVDRKTVRITDDVGEIFGVDQREYDLSTDDVVTLPADNADPLVERDAAEPLE